MTVHIKQVSANLIVRNILLLFSGTSISQLLPFIVTIFLSRLYTQMDFGDLALVMSVSGIVGTVVALRYDLVIILQRKLSQAKTVMALCFSLIVLISFLTFICLFFFRPLLIGIFDISHYSLLYSSIPLIVASTGIYYVFENWFNRQREYKNMIYIKIAQSSTSSVAKVAFGFAGISWGLVGGTIIGYVLTVFICIYLFVRKESFSTKYFSFKKMAQMAVLYQDFVKYATPSGLLNSLSIMGLPILIAYFYSTTMAGVFFFANTIIGIPVFFLANAMAQVFKKEAVVLIQKNKRQELSNLMRKFQQSIFLIVCAFVLVMSLFGADIFAFVFGSQWYESGQLIKFFAFYLILSVYYAVVSCLIDILRLLKAELIFNLSLLLSQCLVFWICSRHLTFEYTLLINSITGSLHFLAINRYVKYKIRVR